jgi:uncharacterized membrane protein YphA (DoxX/SURF4 family)
VLRHSCFAATVRPTTATWRSRVWLATLAPPLAGNPPLERNAKLTMQAVINKVPAAARILLGLIFTVFGLNGFLNFIPMGPMADDAAGAFLGALVSSGYLMTLVKVVEVVGGLMLLANRFVPLALAVIAPVVLNIVLFHAFLAPAGIALALVVLLLELFLAWSYRGAFAPMLRAKTEPAARDASKRNDESQRVAV